MKYLILTLPAFISIILSRQKEMKTFKECGKQYIEDEHSLFIFSGCIFFSLVFFTVAIYQIYFRLNIKFDSFIFWIGFLFLTIHAFIYLLIHSETQKHN